MRVLTWNVEGHTYYRGKLDALVCNILALDPDVLCLQEVSPRLWATLGPRLEKTLPHTTYPQYFGAEGKTTDLYGNCICSKTPMTHERDLVFETKSILSRGFVCATIGAIDIICTHLDSSPDRVQNRLDQIQQLLSYIVTRPNNNRVVVAGDFNSGEESEEHAILEDWLHDTWREGTHSPVDRGFTEDSNANPRRAAVMVERGRVGELRQERFDQVWVSRKKSIVWNHVVRCPMVTRVDGVKQFTYPSDHFALLATLET